MFARTSSSTKYHDHELATASTFTKQNRWQQRSRPEGVGKSLFRIRFIFFRNQAFAEGQRFGCKGGVQQAWLRIVSSAKPPDDDAVRSRRMFARRSCSTNAKSLFLALSSSKRVRAAFPPSTGHAPAQHRATHAVAQLRRTRETSRSYRVVKPTWRQNVR